MRTGGEKNDARIADSRESGECIALRTKERSGRRTFDLRKISAEHRTRSCGSPMRNRCLKELACDRKAPTIGRPASAQDPPPAYEDNCAPGPARPPAAEEMPGWRKEARRKVSIRKEFCEP